MPEVIVSVRGLKKRFTSGKGELHVLRGVDLDINKGEMVTVVGASGVGKSTLLQIMGGLDRPSEGSVLYEGRDIFGMADAALASFRNRHVGFVFQFHHLMQEFTALENVAMPGLIKGMSAKEANGRALAILERVGLKDRGHHRPGALSGGEQQRVAVARALMLEPTIVLADEPTGNLDTHTAESVHSLFRELNLKDRLTMVIVTHNEKLARESDRIIQMVDGQIVGQG